MHTNTHIHAAHWHLIVVVQKFGQPDKYIAEGQSVIIFTVDVLSFWYVKWSPRLPILARLAENIACHAYDEPIFQLPYR